MKKPGPNHKESSTVEAPGCKNLIGPGLNCKNSGAARVDRSLTRLTQVRSNLTHWILIRWPGMHAGGRWRRPVGGDAASGGAGRRFAGTRPN
jgi:hypothetical protein